MTSSRVLVIGDANLDLVLRGDVVPRFGQTGQLLEGISSSARAPGSSRPGLARLGVPVSLAARVGDDIIGTRTRELLRAAGVDCSRLLSSPEPTGLSVVLSAPADRAILTFTGALSTLSDADARDAASALVPTHVPDSRRLAGGAADDGGGPLGSRRARCPHAVRGAPSGSPPVSNCSPRSARGTPVGLCRHRPATDR